MTRRLLSFAALLLLLVSLVPRLAFADEPEPTEQQKEARAHFDKGRTLAAEKSWSAAYAEFLRSRQLDPRPSNTRNAAVALFELGRFEDAADMYEAFLREFPDVPADERAAVQKELSELKTRLGSLMVSSVAGASIVVDGIERGKTPLDHPIRIAVGSHLVRVVREGFEPYEARVDVASGQAKAVDATLVALTRAGRLHVEEKHGATADVLVDNALVGKTPWEGALGAGEHTFVLRGADDLGTPPARVMVRLNEVTQVTPELEPLTAELVVEALPVHAMISVDGVTVGRRRWEGRLRPGAHQVEAWEEGFLPGKVEISLIEHQHELRELKLVRDPSSPIWALEPPPRIYIEASGGLAIAPSLGGDVVGECSGACSKSLPLGGLVLARGGYQLSSGLGFGLTVGYASIGESLDRRATTVKPTGKTGVPATANDRLGLHGVLVGLTGGLHKGDRWPVGLRLDAGLLLGSAKDDLTTSFAPEAINASTTARYFFVAPAASIARRFADHLDVGVGLQAMLLVGITQPKFDAPWPDQGIRLDTNVGYLAANQSLAGNVIFALIPELTVRYDF